MTRADTSADAIYDGLRADFGESSAKASGYLSQYSFLRERGLILDVIGDETGAVPDTAGGTGLVTLPLGGPGGVCADGTRRSCKLHRGIMPVWYMYKVTLPLLVSSLCRG